ncbi:hypothetical protein RvY_04799 [Ramazzottius varieornatus]|uniref:Uncharacterized protein n=1 Tax=Ramazzottius varieornatus TaxID=947166 RepID=A0A1D1USV6_RAMVA|nr:hypothetical protein RvY_04799 [Ramazzottius varieornatus]
MVCLKFNDGVPCLTLLSTNELQLDGKSLETTFGVSGECGMVVGKALNGPGEHLIQLETFDDAAADDFGLSEEDDGRPWIGTQTFSRFRHFACILLDEKD